MLIRGGGDDLPGILMSYLFLHPSRQCANWGASHASAARQGGRLRASATTSSGAAAIGGAHASEHHPWRATKLHHLDSTLTQVYRRLGRSHGHVGEDDKVHTATLATPNSMDVFSTDQYARTKTPKSRHVIPSPSKQRPVGQVTRVMYTRYHELSEVHEQNIQSKSI